MVRHLAALCTVQLAVESALRGSSKHARKRLEKCFVREPAALTAPQEITQCLRDPDPTNDSAPPLLPPASSSSRSRHGGRPSGSSTASGRASSPRTSVAGSEASGLDAPPAQRHRSADGATPRSGLASLVSNGRARSRASSQVRPSATASRQSSL